MAITYNAKGTSYPSFMIGKQGPTIYQSTVPVTPKSGDLYIDPSNIKFDIFNGSIWDSFLTESIADTTYLTSKDPVATGKISLDSGAITSDGSGNLTAVGINIGSYPVATQQYVTTSLASYNPLIGPLLEFGDPKTSVTDLTLAFYQSGMTSGNVSTSDVEITISNGTAGSENKGTLTINSNIANVVASNNISLTSGLNVNISGQNSVILSGLTVQLTGIETNICSANSSSDSSGWGVGFSTSDQELSSVIQVQKNSDSTNTNVCNGNMSFLTNTISFGGTKLYGVTSIPARNITIGYQSSGNDDIFDATIVASGGGTTPNQGTLTYSASKIDFTGVSTLTAITPTIGDSSKNIATTEFVQSTISNLDNNPLSGPIVIYGSETESISGGLSLDYYISGPPKTGSVTTDAQVMITNGLSGTANQSTFEIISKNIILNSSYLTTTSSSLDIGNQTDTKKPIISEINFYLNGSSVQDANINISGGVAGTENGGVIQINAATLDCSTSISNMTVPDVASSSDSSTKAANTAFVQSVVGNYLPLSGGILTGNLNLDYSGSLINIGSSTEVNTPNIFFYSSGNGYTHSDAYISCSGGSTIANSGALKLYGGSINLDGATVTAPTPPDADNSTKVATTEFVTSALKNSNEVLKNYTVADLIGIVTPSIGAIAYASDGRKPGETVANGYSSGSGVPVFYDGNIWLSFGSFQEVTN